jgi:hypothetical protein
METCQSIARLAAREAGYRFAFVPGQQVRELSASNLESFKQLAPVMVFLQAGSWALPLDDSRLDNESREKSGAFQKHLLEAFKRYDPSRPVVVATSAATLGHLAFPLTNAGAFDLAFGIPEPSVRSRGELFIDLVGRDLCGTTILENPDKVGKALTLTFKTREGPKLAALHLRRLAARERRKVEFVDLVEVYTRDFLQVAPVFRKDDTMREQVATHEAGHAVMSVLDSGGSNVPDFCSIIPSADFKGVVVSSIAHQYHTANLLTYEAFRHSVRVSLAGRAAEELAYGPLKVGDGARADLANATRLATRAFSELGFAPAMHEPGACRSNLAVVLDSPTQAEHAYTMELVRRFLHDEYTAVFESLGKNSALLESVRDCLLQHPVVDRSELIEVCRRHGVQAFTAEEE